MSIGVKVFSAAGLADFVEMVVNTESVLTKAEWKEHPSQATLGGLRGSDFTFTDSLFSLLPAILLGKTACFFLQYL